MKDHRHGGDLNFCYSHVGLGWGDPLPVGTPFRSPLLNKYNNGLKDPLRGLHEIF